MESSNSPDQLRLQNSRIFCERERRTIFEQKAGASEKTARERNQGHDKRGEIWMSLITCGSIHQGNEWFSDDSRGRQEIFMCSGALLIIVRNFTD